MRLITLAIHTYEHALAVKSILEAEGIDVTLQNVNLETPEVSSGVRVRIPETDLPLALRIVENQDIFRPAGQGADPAASRHTIVVPTDFSSHAFKAAEVAARLAKRHKAGLHFLHSFLGPRLTGNVQLSDNLTYEVAEPRGTEELAAEAERQMHDMLADFKGKMKNGSLPVVKYTHAVVEGVPEDSIVEHARLNPPYLVVMGTRNFDRKEREMIGSVTAEVLDESRFSVLTIPENLDISHVDGPHNILFFSNLDQEDILAMDTLYRIFPDAKACVRIIHIPRRLRFTDRAAGHSAIALSEYCAKRFGHFTFETVPVTPKTALAELEGLQSRHNFDLIVIPNRRKNAFSRLFNPGLAHKILFRADIPMLVIPV
ncbi:MAG: universal stress protein [Bacteroidales bacterium]|nr:universal stress protein [Bacteroidales bacterium]